MTRLERWKLARKRPLLRFQATYNLAAAHQQRYLDACAPGAMPPSDADQQPALDFAEAVRRTQSLVGDIERALSWFDARRRPPRRALRARQSDLIAVEGPAVALLAGLYAMALSGQDPSAASACACPSHPQPDSREYVIAVAKPAPCPNLGNYPRLLVDCFLLDDARRASPRARYNLACHFSRVAAMREAAMDPAAASDAREAATQEIEGLLERALAELAYAVETGDLVDLAADDPALKELRERKPAEVWQTIGRTAPAQSTGLLSKIRAIGPSFAAKLEIEGVSTASDLSELTPEGAADLATTVGASTELVARWRTIANLMTAVDSLGVDGANLLDELRINSVSELAAVSEEQPFTVKIAALNTAMSIAATTPTLAQVTLWIRQAMRAAAATT